MAMEYAVREELQNVVFIDADAAILPDLFDVGEIDLIYLNFCDPWPRNKTAKLRLTYRTFLEKYQTVLKDGGQLHFKTDNGPLFDFSLEEVKESGWELLVCTYDLHHDKELMKGNVMTEYERKFSNLRNPIHKLVIRKPNRNAE